MHTEGAKEEGAAHPGERQWRAGPCPHFSGTQPGLEQVRPDLGNEVSSVRRRGPAASQSSPLAQKRSFLSHCHKRSPTTK